MALAAHPELAQTQDRLLQENTTSGTTVLSVRRDDMGYRANTIDFSKCAPCGSPPSLHIRVTSGLHGNHMVAQRSVAKSECPHSLGCL